MFHEDENWNVCKMREKYKVGMKWLKAAVVDLSAMFHFDTGDGIKD